MKIKKNKYLTGLLLVVMLLLPLGNSLFANSQSADASFTETFEQKDTRSNIALVTLKDSTGVGLAGGVVSYYAGGWAKE
ncbi:MAG: hypothetical protein GX083_04895 [Clostridiales bacterium]|nr:hypothetical protein [Clostridiales bacterium]